MKNQRIKADNVDQLLEIVRAVQRGEDPGEALEKVKAEKEKAEAIAMAEAMAAAEEEKRAAEEKKAARKKKVESEKEQAEEPDEFELGLENEKADRMPLKETARQMKAGLWKAAGLFSRGSGKTADKIADKKKEKAAVVDTEEDSWNDIQKEIADEVLQEKPQTENADDVPKEEMQNSVDMPLHTEKDSETLDRLFENGIGGGRMLGRERLSSHSNYSGSDRGGFRKTERLQETEDEQNSSNTAETDSEKKTKTAQSKLWKIGSGVGAALAGWKKTLNEKEQEEEFEEEFEESVIEENVIEETENKPETECKEINAEIPGEELMEDSEEILKKESMEGSEEIPEKETTEESEEDAEITVPEETGEKIKVSRRKISVQKMLNRLRNREFSKRGSIMLAAVGVLLLLLIVAVVNIVQHSMEQKKKRENVAADKGLIVTVENDPQEWCSSYMLELRFRTKGKPVTKVVINETALQPDADGNVVYAASEYRLEATAVTEDMTYQAVIELPKLDSLPPVTYAQREDNQIILTASDDRSSIRKIWYAELEDNDFIRLPVYQEYTGAIPYQKDSLYYFYAEDAAGNCSSPVITTMERAEKLQFEEEQVMLYPDETVYLDVQVLPEQALLNGLQFTSSDPSVAVVDESGKLTALAEGKATITASAEGVAETVCSVEVARERTVTLSAIGDCTLGADQSFNTNVNFNAFAAMNGNAYFFQNVADILKNDDVTFANLEGTLTTSTAREAKQYAFKGDPSYTEILNSGSVEVVTLANNHSSDYGEQSLTDTKTYLTEAGIEYCMGDTYVVKNVNGVKTAFIGIYVLRDGMERETQVRETIAAAKADGAELVIVGFHWGSEKATEPDETQQSLAHIAVDCGADLVVGHHPHVLQGIEKYNGKYIVYSLGNFCFGGNTAPSDTDTIIFRQTFTIRDGKVQNDDQIGIIPCSITSADGYNDYKPTPANEERSKRIMERINQYSEPFGQSYTASNGLE